MNNPRLFRTATRGAYETDLSLINALEQFPSPEIIDRNKNYKYCQTLYDGSYSKNRMLKAKFKEATIDVNYKVTPINQFKLTVSKLDSLIFGNEVTIKTGDIERDSKIENLMIRTNFIDSIRKALTTAEIRGDSCMKIYRNGVSTFSPEFAYKVVSEFNVNETLAIVSYQYIFTGERKTKRITHIHFEVAMNGVIFEQVFSYNGNTMYGTLGYPVEYEFDGTLIPKDGLETFTGINDETTTQWIRINQADDEVYGKSPLLDINDIVTALELRLSSEQLVLDKHESPLLVLDEAFFSHNESTGNMTIKSVAGKYLPVGSGQNRVKPEYVTWNGNLEASQLLKEDLMGYLYQLSELGRPFMTGEYTGNISEETMNNTIKSAIDRARRDLSDINTGIRNALYVLCNLNGIAIEKEELKIEFNVGRSDDLKSKIDLMKSMKDSGLLSDKTILEKVMGWNAEQAMQELALKAEQTSNTLVKETSEVKASVPTLDQQQQAESINNMITKDVTTAQSS